MKMYRNYDGQRSTFGDMSVKTSTPNPDTVSAFGAIRAKDGALTVMVINKQATAGVNLSLNISNFSAGGPAKVWQLSSSNAITRLPDVPVVTNVVVTIVPSQSITLLVLPPASLPAPPWLQADSTGTPDKFELWVNGQAGHSYVLQSTTNFSLWTVIQTNTLSSNSWHGTISALPRQPVFYRVRELP